ncbi:DUF7344 domain-containing protein [Natronorubrum sp. DTA28]|uniref:DUF7344 domain-containing protein n=1 Tax=Natronorubrum sp. DTA28 TaxID=3447019 RepID=UPI003F8280DB
MRFATPLQSELKGWGESSAAIVAMGLALAAVGIVQTITTPATQPVVALELFVSFLVPTGLATGGYWLASRNVAPDVRSRVAIWVSIGIVAACGLGGWLVLYVSLEGGTIVEPLSLVTTLAAVGGATGFVAAVCVMSRESASDTAAPFESGSGPDTAHDSTRADDPRRNYGDEREALSETETAAESAASTPVSAPTVTAPKPATDCPLEPTETAASIESADPPEPIVPDETVPLAPSPGELEPSVERVAAVPGTTETVLEVLRDERSRIVLARLYHDADKAQSLADLARVVAAHTDQCAATAAVSLRHATLPRLAAIRAIDWDPHADRVSAPENALFEEGVRDASALLEAFEPGTR